MRYCVRCGWRARTRKERKTIWPQCGRRTSPLLFNRILDGRNNILYEGHDKDNADLVWEEAVATFPLVKRIEYAALRVEEDA